MASSGRLLSLDEYIMETGEWGWFQTRTQIIFVLFMFPLSNQIFMSYFVVHNPPWRCVNNSTVCLFNDTITAQDHARFKAKCSMGRSEWEFTKPKKYSLVTEFDLVCDKEKYAIASTSMLFIGWSIGGTGIAWLSDFIGRKRTIFMCTAVILVTVLLVVSVANVMLYIISRFIIGICLGGGPVTIFVLAAEIVCCKYRAFSCAVIWIYYAFCLAILALIAYLSKAWRIIELAVTLPFLLLIFTWRYFPESIRWMCIRGKTKEAEALLAEIATLNKKPVPDASLATPPCVESSSICNLFHPFAVFLETFVQILMWFCAGLTYYALSLASQDMTGNFYSDFVFISLAEVPATVALIYLCNKIGRKKTVISHLYLSVVACVAVAYIPLDLSNPNELDKVGRFAAGVIGKYAVSVYFNTAYVWSAELVPTVVRTQGVGLLVVISRLGGAVSPLVTTTLKLIRTDVPFLVLAVCNLIAGTLTFTLRETKDSVIFETVEEKLEYMGLGKKARKGDK